MSFLSDFLAKIDVNVGAVNTRYHAIIDADLANNYVGRDYDPRTVRAAFDLYKARGGQFRASEQTIIFYKTQDAKTVEFHTMNAGTGVELAEFVVTFLRDMAAEFAQAVTYFDNEKITQLLKYSPCRVELDRIDEGEDRTFRAKFYLREVL